MKKFFAAAAGVCLAVCLVSAAGCSEDLSPEGKDWRFAFVQGQAGQVLFCSEEYAAVYPDAERAEGICSAEDGGIAIAVADKEYSGTYRKADGDGKSALYVALFGEEEWNMVCGVTERTDGEEYTLILSSKGYAVTFYADVD